MQPLYENQFGNYQHRHRCTQSRTTHNSQKRKQPKWLPTHGKTKCDLVTYIEIILRTKKMLIHGIKWKVSKNTLSRAELVISHF